MLLLIVHGHVRPIGGSGCRGREVPMARRLARGLYMSLGRDESKLRGSDTFDDAVGARTRRKMSPKALISPEISPQGSGGMEFITRAISD
jgi:hypothetical protein